MRYLQAVLSDVPRKNSWQIAEQAREAHPYGMQRLLSRAVWDQDAVRDELRAWSARACSPATARLQEQQAPFPVLVLDESGFPKRGRHSAGVAPQYCGVSRARGELPGGRLPLLRHRPRAMPSSTASYICPRTGALTQPVGSPLIFLRRCAFQTKPELGQQMIERAQEAFLPIRWVVADSVYGHSPDLRAFLEDHGLAYALAVPSIEVVCVQTRTGLLLSDVASLAQQALRARDWQRLSQSLGTKGERLFDWARLPVAPAGVVDGRHWLVIRRCLDDPSELAYYLVWAPPDTPLSTMVAAIGGRWRIEEDLEASKALGLDHAEVRSYLGWYRHITLVLLAYAFLVNITVQSHRTESPPCRASSRPPTHPVDFLRSPSPAGPPVLPGTEFGAPDLSLVVVAAHSPVLGRLLSSSPPRQSRLSLVVEPPSFPRTGPGNLPGSFPGRSPGGLSRVLSVPYERSDPMTIVPLAQAARRLGIDAKTLHRWLAEEELALQPHPADARKKGLSSEQLLRLAQHHQRCLTPLPSEMPSLPTALLALPERLDAVQAQLDALQQQVAQLTHLLQVPAPSPVSPAGPTQPSRTSPRASAPAAPRARPAASARAKPPRQPVHVIPRVEYVSESHYVVICPKQGVLPFELETPEWFAWVAEQSSFRFVGKAGQLLGAS